MSIIEAKKNSGDASPEFLTKNNLYLPCSKAKIKTISGHVSLVSGILRQRIIAKCSRYLLGCGIVGRLFFLVKKIQV
jgi:hypothetical protein